MNKTVLLIFTFLFLSCAATQSIIIPINDFPSYKKTMAERGERITKTDTIKGADGKMLIIYYTDTRP